MCIDKMVRLAETPYKEDSWDDIQGYASLWEGSVEEYEGREKGIILEDITD
jgi:hypothetical protein